MIGHRLKGKVEQYGDEEQCGFRKGRGTRDVILVLRGIMEKAIEKHKDLSMNMTCWWRLLGGLALTKLT